MSYIITVNEPGCLPETDPAETDNLVQALEVLREEVARTADAEDTDAPEIDAVEFTREMETWAGFSVMLAGYNHEVIKVG